ncbi:hypothetical protein GCM10027346_40440 [Hymenobacter seoulensis]
MRLYFENPVGRILEHPDGYVLIRYHAGPRDLFHLQAFLTHTGRLLQLRKWNKLFGDQRLMEPFTDEEGQWIVEYWLSESNQNWPVYGAVLVAPEALASLPEALRSQPAHAGALTYRLFDDEQAAATWLLQCS